MNVIYPNHTWRNDADGVSRLIGSGGGAIPAVIGACGKSELPQYQGQFWISSTPENPSMRYAESLEVAKRIVESDLK